MGGARQHRHQRTFRLNESRARSTVVTKNWNYFDAAVPGLEGIPSSLRGRRGGAEPVPDRHGGLHGRHRAAVPSGARMGHAHGYHGIPACASHGWRSSRCARHSTIRQLRYALNMATGKSRWRVSWFRQAGQSPRAAHGGYRSPKAPYRRNQRPRLRCSGLQSAAREIWAASTAPAARLPLDIHCIARTDSLLVAEVLQSQWRSHLGLNRLFHKR